MLAAGSIGTYLLLKKLFFDNKIDSVSQTLPLIGGLFYIFNLSTVQTFYAPLEPYLTHFGLLPFLILSGVNFLKKSSKKNWLILIAINIAAIPQSQVPTIFFVYLLTIFILVFWTIS